jgi:hypothetical protein
MILASACGDQQMTDKSVSQHEFGDKDDTMTVAPPGFRERVAAAQKAKTSEIRQSVEIPNPLLKRTEGSSGLPATGSLPSPTPDSKA